jgi:hypothetical protein
MTGQSTAPAGSLETLMMLMITSAREHVILGKIHVTAWFFDFLQDGGK